MRPANMEQAPAQETSTLSVTPRRAGILSGAVGVRFDWLMVLASCWFVGGAYLDGWAHVTLSGIDTFFSPWHAVLYSGFGAILALLMSTIAVTRSHGGRGLNAIPFGYGLSLVGIAIFLSSAVGDLIWHEIFGIENDVAALVSPTHLGLDAGGALILAGPFRARRHRARFNSSETEWMATVPSVISLTLVFALLGFVTQFAHPFGFTWMGNGYRPVEGAVVISTAGGNFPAELLVHLVGLPPLLLHAAFVTSFVLVLLAANDLRIGCLTLGLGLTGASVALMHSAVLSTAPVVMIAAAVTSGVLCDLFRWLVRPSMDRIARRHLFAGGVPVLTSATYCTAIILAEGTWWPVHLWVGAIVLSGTVGLLLSCLASVVQTRAV